MSDRLAGIVESSLVTDLGAPAPAGAGDWVRPDNLARRTGPGGLEQASPGQSARVVDFAASMGWGYALVPASGSGGAWHKLVRAAASKKVGLLIGPRDAAALPLADFITGMTDRYALRTYQEYFLPRPWTVV